MSGFVFTNPTDRIQNGGLSARVGATGALVLSAAVSRVTPGVTSFAITNSAGGVNNFSMLDAGWVGLLGAVPQVNVGMTMSPVASGASVAYGYQANPTWTDPGAGGTNAAFNSLTNIVLTAHNTGTVNDFYSVIAGDASAWNYNQIHNLNGTITINGSGTVTLMNCVNFQAITAPGSSSNVGEIGGAHLNGIHSGSGVATLIYGVVGRAGLGPTGGAADGNVTSSASFYSEMYMTGTAVTPGVVALHRDYLASGPNFTSGSVTSKISTNWNFYGLNSFNTYNHTSVAGGFVAGGMILQTGIQGGNTSGTNLNYGLYVSGGGGASASGGTVSNFAAEIILPAPVGVAGGNNANYGVYVHGNGGTGSGTVSNFAIYSDSSAVVSFKGFLGLGPNLTPTSPLHIVPGVVTSGSPTGMLYTGAAHVTLANAETPDAIFNLARIVQFTGSATLGTQRSVVVAAATYASDTATKVITASSTFAITGPPIAGTNVTLTSPNSSSLWLAQGVATVAGGSLAAALAIGVTASIPTLGLFWGSGVPTIAAPQGSLYLRTDGSSTSTRLYVNTNAATTWTGVTTAA